MANVLFLNPNRWGRGITALWIPSHAAVLKSRGHDVRLFDATFYKDWRHDEVAYNTANQQYKPSDYDRYIRLKEDVSRGLEECIRSYDPDVIFWSGLSSFIHGEGEYVNIQYGHQLVESCRHQGRALKIAGGLQPTADPDAMPRRFPRVDYFIRGESEFVLADLVDRLHRHEEFISIRGLVWRTDSRTVVNPTQEILTDMDRIPPYDYSLFEDQVFFRPYQGQVVRAVDYELSRGCLYTCSYCVETVIQRYYGFKERTPRGALRNPKGYLRHKSAERVFEEMRRLTREFGITLFRCQDTNFLTIDRKTLLRLAELLEGSGLDVKLYIETRPDGINRESIALLKRLKVDGVGMGVELASEEFRETHLNRFADKDKIVEAFRLLREAGIKRTAYNIIGLPDEDEAMLLQTIRFNRLIDPDNVTVAFYSPYLGTEQQTRGVRIRDFNDYEYNVDAQLRTLSRSTRMSKETLEFYKRYFVRLVREGLEKLEAFKRLEPAAV
ncbi:MAG TPA: hypothetical protein DD714_00635 [Candidatus Omnitrophica bacterium]|nr:hypothetical protein [Candidatus Omnitrophota bacterium]